MFPVLDSTEIERVRRFGTTRSYRSGETLVAVGNVSPGLTIILRGRVEVTQNDQSGRRHIVGYETGSFVGELPSGDRSAHRDATY